MAGEDTPGETDARGRKLPHRYNETMYRIETEQEADGRWIAEVPELPGVLVYGATREEAVRKAQTLSLRVLADRLENGEALPEVQTVFKLVA